MKTSFWKSWGSYLMQGHTQLVTWGIFARCIAALYFITFSSLLPQILGLYGETGIFPIKETMEYMQNEYGLLGPFIFPTLFWINASNVVIFSAILMGVAFSMLILWGKKSRIFFPLLWILYLSFVTVGGDFLFFPWDFLFLEAGFLAIFLPPLRTLPKIAVVRELPRLLPLVIQWLLFRFILSMGLAKFWRPHEAWVNLTYTKTFFLWQPNPGPFAWYFYHMPMWFHNMLAIGIFFTQIIAPLLLFGPRRIRQLAALSIIISMLPIMATGNFGIFNIITIVLCIPFFDDGVFLQFLPKKMAAKQQKKQLYTFGMLWKSRCVNVFAVLLIILGTLYPLALLHPDSDEISSKITWVFRSEMAKKYLPSPAVPVMQALATYHILHPHGFFRWPFNSRNVVILEGSNDRVNWAEYKYAFHTQDVTNRPRWFAPYQPRIDHQLFYEANRTNFYKAHFNPFDHELRIPPRSWFDRFIQRLLENDPSVLRLIARNPFPDNPPLYIRGVLYDYRYSTPEEKAESGDWWVRTLKDEYYYPPIQYGEVVSKY